MVNSALLESTLNHIRDFPELHDQAWFFTQTEAGLCACYAGRACLLAGLQPVMEDSYWGRLTSARVWMADGTQSARLTARDLLGLDTERANNLFMPYNTYQLLELKVKDILNGDPEVRSYLDHL